MTLSGVNHTCEVFVDIRDLCMCHNCANIVTGLWPSIPAVSGLRALWHGHVAV
jgi:hypothetical protein